jgi:hypothetical protein
MKNQNEDDEPLTIKLTIFQFFLFLIVGMILGAHTLAVAIQFNKVRINQPITHTVLD